MQRRAIHGVLLVDKPLTWTSNDALQKCKGLLGALKGGHTGTLDPLATGLLPLCFGAATKFSQASLDADKRYRATLHLGQRRVGGDLEGEVIEDRPVTCDAAAVREVLARFTGPLLQTPPMHSALKHQGRALYEYARNGIEVPREPRPVVVHAIELIDWALPLLVLDVRCSKGTYIRTLAEDIGTALGCGAHLAALRRTACGPLGVADAISIEAFEALSPEARAKRLLPPEALLADWPAITLPAEEAARFLTGLRRRLDPARHADAAQQRVHGPDGAFLGSAHITAGELIADRLLSPDEVRACAAPTPMPQAAPGVPA